MERKLNYKMITLARESRGLTQKELSQKIPSLNQGNLSKIERDQLPINEDMCLSIAKTLNYPIEFFYQKEVQTPVSNFYYRKRASVSKKALSKFEARVDIIRKVVDKLCEEIETDDFRFPQLEIGAHNTPEEAARAIRNFLKIPRGPIKDLITVLENYGILIYFIDVDEEGIDGITVFTDSGRPIMFINQSYPNDRKRFTIAHELGHLVMHIPFVLETWRDEEQEANNFASEFLMPENDCLSHLVRLRFNTLSDLKSYWGVSKAAIIRRAYSLKLITKETYTYFNIELGRRGERKVEKGYVEIDTPKLLKEILDLNLAEIHYSKTEISKVVCLNEKDFQDNFIEMGNRKFKLVHNKVA